MNAVATPADRTSNSAGTAAWVCLAIAWICFLVPIPGIGLFIGVPLNLVGFILAIVAMSKSGAMAGLFQLLSSLIVSPIVYFIGLAIMVAMVGGAAQASAEAQQARQALLSQQAEITAAPGAIENTMIDAAANPPAADAEPAMPTNPTP